MFRILIAAIAFLAATVPASAAPCAGVDLAVGSVSVKSLGDSGKLNRYTITGTVTNVGSASQASDAVQSVDIYQGSEKVGNKTIPRLRAGQSSAFSYNFERPATAKSGTTQLRFQLNIWHPSPADSQSCNMENDSFTLTF